MTFTVDMDAFYAEFALIRPAISQAFGHPFRDDPAGHFVMIRPSVSRPFGHPLGGSFAG